MASIIQGDASNWLSNGRTYDERRHSPLNQINLDNIDDLSDGTGTPAPSAVRIHAYCGNGIMFNSARSMVWAHDVAAVVEFDPQVDQRLGVTHVAMW